MARPILPDDHEVLSDFCRGPAAGRPPFHRGLAGWRRNCAAHAGDCDENGRHPVVRSGSHQPPEMLTSVAAIEVTAPRVNDWAETLDGERPGRRNRMSAPGDWQPGKAVTNQPVSAAA